MLADLHDSMLHTSTKPTSPLSSNIGPLRPHQGRSSWSNPSPRSTRGSAASPRVALPTSTGWRPPTATFWRRPLQWRQGTPSRMSREDMQNFLCPTMHRLSPRERTAALRKWNDAQTTDWIATHCAPMRAIKQDFQPERLAILKEAFELMDTDRSGKIDSIELSAAMRVLGFGPEAVREAMRDGDRDNDGELDFSEFAAMVSRAGTGKNSRQAADVFPFSLIADSYRISRLIDSYVMHASSSPPSSSRGHSAREGRPDVPVRVSAQRDGQHLPEIRQRARTPQTHSQLGLSTGADTRATTAPNQSPRSRPSMKPKSVAFHDQQ